MRLFSRSTAGIFLAATGAVLAVLPGTVRGNQPAPCPQPRAGVPAWYEAGPVNRNRNLRFAVDVGGVTLIYDSERTAIATPYGGAGWSLGLATSSASGATVVIEEGGARTSFTEAAGAFQPEAMEERALVRTGPDAYELRSDGGMVRVFSGGREVALRGAAICDSRPWAS
jgi:hypothetical protein